jgi:hypothetical protein
MNKHRSVTYRKRWKELVNQYGSRCFYCQKEPATTIDHVIPYSWDQDNDLDNLVPACGLCNCLASNMVFDSVEHKRQYILEQRKKRSNQRAICKTCLLPFSYRIHSPSLILCAECYDEEYGTHVSRLREWTRWLNQLQRAGIPPEAHRTMKRRIDFKAKREARLEMLLDEYASIVDTDDQFAEMLMVC